MMLKQFSAFAISRRALAFAAAIALSLAAAGCGVKGPLVPAPKDEGKAAATPPTAAPPAAPPLIKDPEQPERRP